MWGEGINLTVLYSESSLNAEDESCPHCSKEWDELRWNQIRLTVVQEWRQTHGVLCDPEIMCFNGSLRHWFFPDVVILEMIDRMET